MFNKLHKQDSNPKLLKKEFCGASNKLIHNLVTNSPWFTFERGNDGMICA